MEDYKKIYPEVSKEDQIYPRTPERRKRLPPPTILPGS